MARFALEKKSVCNFGLFREYDKRLQNVRMAVARESQSSPPHVVDTMTRGLTRDAAKRSGMSVCKEEQGGLT